MFGNFKFKGIFPEKTTYLKVTVKGKEYNPSLKDLLTTLRSYLFGEAIEIEGNLNVTGNLEVDGDTVLNAGLTVTNGETTLSELIVGGGSITQISAETGFSGGVATETITLVIGGETYLIGAEKQ